MSPKLPTGRISRGARLGRVAASQSLGVASDRVRGRGNEERTDELRHDRAMSLAEALVDQMGHMKGAAMKLGQVLSTTYIPTLTEEENARWRAKLSSLRDEAPPMEWRRVEKVLTRAWGQPVSRVVSDITHEAIAAASIGQVHQATLHDGSAVAIKIQYPGVADAIDADMRNLRLLTPMLRGLFPQLDIRALFDELTERMGEEVDYEMEAQHQRALSRAYREHPFAFVPAAHTDHSTRHVLVSEWVPGEGFAWAQGQDEEVRDRIGEQLLRFYWGSCFRLRWCSGDPHPGNYRMMPDGRIGILDWGFVRRMRTEYLTLESDMMGALRRNDVPGAYEAAKAAGFLAQSPIEPEILFALLAVAAEIWTDDEFRRLDPRGVSKLLERSTTAPMPDGTIAWQALRGLTLPGEALLLRRMEGLLLSVFGDLYCGAHYGQLVREYTHREPASTPIGQAEQQWWARRHPGVS